MQKEPSGEGEKKIYTGEDLSREAEANMEERVASGHQKPEEFEGDRFYDNFLNNFHGHLPGGYKYRAGLNNPRLDKLDDDIDRTISALGLDEQEIALWRKQKPVSDDEKQKQLETYNMLYIEMRNLGYTHSELAS